MRIIDGPARLASRFAARLRARGSSWPSDRRANVTITYAFALIPVLGLIGLGSDWFKQQSYKKRLDAAADSAAIAAITTAKAYVTANSSQSNAIALGVAAGAAQAQKTFALNAGSASLNMNIVPTVNFPVPSGQTYTATVSYATAMPTNFGQLVGTRTFNIQGSSTSSLTIGQYIDFYVLVDVSGSMGIPTTSAGQTLLAAINPDNRAQYPTGCVFACHFPGNQGYSLAEANNIPLRVDTVGYAVSQLLATATNWEAKSGIANEFRIGLYPFITHAIDAAPLNADFTQASFVAANLGKTYLDQGWSGNSLPSPTASNGVQIGSGGTHFENLVVDMPNYIKNFGSGATAGQTASAPKPFLFLISDGMDNNQTYSPWTGSQAQVPNTSFCSLAKAYGFTVSVLYIPYVPISNPNPSFAGDEDDQANNTVPQLPSTLQSCASTGFFFTASSPSDIQNALQTMFFQSLQSARLTQ